MKCYFCNAQFLDDGDCPGVCHEQECRKASDDPDRWKEFEAAKLAHIIEAMRGPGKAFMHATFDDGGSEWYQVDIGGEA